MGDGNEDEPDVMDGAVDEAAGGGDDAAADDAAADGGTAAPRAAAAGEPVPPVRIGGAALHPLLVTIPIGAFVCTFLFDLASRFSEGYVYARGAMWLCVIGIVAAVVAGAVGGADARRRIGDPSARKLALRHAVLNGLGVLAFLVSLLLRRSDLDSLLGGTPVAPLVLAGVGLVLLLVSALTGGALAGRLDRPAA